MKPLYTEEEFKKAKSIDKLPCECYHCCDTFYLTKHRINMVLNPNRKDVLGKYCQNNCRSNSKEKVICLSCGVEFVKDSKEIKRFPNHFCSRSCAASHRNKNKTTGNRRSKLEIWLEEELTKLYHDLPIDFNKKDTIGSELDIYIPSLNVAIELNGIFHYEPIYGTNKLDQIQNNDKSKSLACHEAKIDLCIIDTSQQKYVKPSTSQKYLDIIINIINERIIRNQD
jgi:hypothetical protein